MKQKDVSKINFELVRLALVDEQTIAKAHEEISYSSVELLRREPFFGHLVSGLTRHITTSIDTVAVGLRGDTIQLIVNPLFYEKTKKKRTPTCGVEA